jgi:hypothetical protein
LPDVFPSSPPSWVGAAQTLRPMQGSPLAWGVGAVVAANPIMILVALAMLARAYQMAKDSDNQSLWRQIVEGGVPPTVVLGVASMTGGSPLFGVAAGLIVAKGIKDALKSGPGFERSEWLEAPATRIATVVTKLRGHRGWAREFA